MPTTPGTNEKYLERIAALEQQVRDLQAILGLHDDHLGVFFQLPKSLSQILGLLLAVPSVTPEMITQRLEIATDAKVAMHRLRLHLKPYHQALGLDPNDENAEIIRSRRGLGYWIDATTKDSIQSLVTPKVTITEVAEEAEPLADAA